MPTVFELFGIRYYFYSGDHEPMHIHLENDDGKAKVFVEPEISIDYNHGIKQKDMNKALKTIELYKDNIVEVWKKSH